MYNYLLFRVFLPFVLIKTRVCPGKTGWKLAYHTQEEAVRYRED